jgi:hypothetical protein
VTWQATTRIKAGVGDLMWRISDDQTHVRYSVAGRSGGRVTLCVVHTIHVEETRNVGFSI